jgi:RNA methyltransferase, TrmH family
VTHAVGVWPTLEALRHRPRAFRRVVCHPRLPPRERAEVAAAAAAAGVPLIEDAARVRGLRRHRAAWVVTELEPEDDALRADLDHLVLVRPAQPGNVGAAMRAALGFGVRDVALIDPRVDPWSPHVLRASQGARFALRARAWPHWRAYRDDHAAHAVVALVPPATGAPLPLPALVPPPLAAWTFGPEGGVLPNEALDGAVAVTIPQDPALESHNLAVAVGVALYARAAAASPGGTA